MKTKTSSMVPSSLIRVEDLGDEQFSNMQKINREDPLNENNLRLLLTDLYAQSKFNTNVDISSWFTVSTSNFAVGYVHQKSQASDFDLPILTTFESCTDFSAALWRSSIEKIFKPESLICIGNKY